MHSRWREAGTARAQYVILSGGNSSGTYYAQLMLWDLAPLMQQEPMGPIIVVAEDNQPFRSMLVSTLTMNGYTPIPAADGHEALLRVKESVTAALLIDVSLPGMSGVRVVEVLRAQEEWANLPVIGMSGYDLPDDEAELFTCFLQKPLVLAELLGYLHQLAPLPSIEDEAGS